MDLLIDIYTIFELIYMAFFIVCLGLSQFGDSIDVHFSKKFRIVFWVVSAIIFIIGIIVIKPKN